LAARERLVPTAVPEGVAFLHARRRASDKFPKQFIAMGRSPGGVVFGSPDMGKTNIFFLLALRNDALHLRWLSRLAWIVRNPTRLGRLLEAESANAIHAAMLEAASALPGALRPTGAPAGR
jgi:mannitol/fructose-specific phosphotransferase system IIA component (Ntr-type)